MEGAIETLLAPDQAGQPRVMTYAECEAEYNNEDSRVRGSFDGISFLIKISILALASVMAHACHSSVLTQGSLPTARVGATRVGSNGPAPFNN